MFYTSVRSMGTTHLRGKSSGGRPPPSSVWATGVHSVHSGSYPYTRNYFCQESSAIGCLANWDAYPRETTSGGRGLPSSVWPARAHGASYPSTSNNLWRTPSILERLANWDKIWTLFIYKKSPLADTVCHRAWPARAHGGSYLFTRNDIWQA